MTPRSKRGSSAGELGGAPTRSYAGLFAGLMLALLAGPAAAQPLSRGGATAHDHSTTAKGGATLAPTTLTMGAASAATFAGSVSLSSSVVATSSVTVGPSVVSSTENAAAVLLGGESIVASTNVIGVAAATFTVTNSSGAVYFIVFKATQNVSTADWGIRFNTDASPGGTNYAYHYRCDNSAGSSAVPASGGAAGILMGEVTTNRFPATSNGKGWFYVMLGDGTEQPTVEGRITITKSSAVTSAGCPISGTWKSNAAVTQIVIYTSAGTFTGKFRLYKMTLPVALQ